MNAQYYTEISLGNPPQTVNLFNPILCTLTNPALVQSHSRHWVRLASSFSRGLTDFALVQAISGFRAFGVPPLPASSILNMTRALPRPTRKMEPNSRSNMALDLWKALSLTMCCRLEIFRSKNRILQRLLRNQALLLLSGSESINCIHHTYKN